MARDEDEERRNVVKDRWWNDVEDPAEVDEMSDDEIRWALEEEDR